MVHPFQYLTSSTDPDALKVAKVYLAVPESYGKLVSPEAYCQAAGVSPYRVLEIITGLAVRLGAPAATVLASIMLRDVVQSVIDKALQPDGDKDRELFFRLAEYLPKRSGW